MLDLSSFIPSVYYSYYFDQRIIRLWGAKSPERLKEVEKVGREIEEVGREVGEVKRLKRLAERLKRWGGAETETKSFPQLILQLVSST